MEQLSTPERGKLAFNTESLDAVTFGPYQRNIYLKIEAFSILVDGDHDAFGWLELHIGGTSTRTEHKGFGAWHKLRLEKELFLTAGSSIIATILSGNKDGVTEKSRGIQVIDWYWMP
jgi:hypothetical protein